MGVWVGGCLHNNGVEVNIHGGVNVLIDGCIALGLLDFYRYQLIAGTREQNISFLAAAAAAGEDNRGNFQRRCVLPMTHRPMGRDIAHRQQRNAT